MAKRLSVGEWEGSVPSALPSSGPGFDWGALGSFARDIAKIGVDAYAVNRQYKYARRTAPRNVDPGPMTSPGMLRDRGNGMGRNWKDYMLHGLIGRESANKQQVNTARAPAAAGVSQGTMMLGLLGVAAIALLK